MEEKKQEHLTSNPRRHEMKTELANARIFGRAAKLRGDHESRKLWRRKERSLSKELAMIAPFIGEAGQEVWTEGHFKRFRHSSRLAKYEKIWNGEKNIWKQKRKEDIA